MKDTLINNQDKFLEMLEQNLEKSDEMNSIPEDLEKQGFKYEETNFGST